MLLYTGTSSINLKYSLTNVNKVTKFKSRGQSVGNYLINRKLIGTSETTRNKITEKVKKISIHVPQHIKPNDKELGNYLAGLIDSSDALFNNKLQLFIIFNLSDIRLVYNIKTRIGYGKIMRKKDEILLLITKPKGIEKVINLINNKFRSVNVFNQITNMILINPQYYELNKNIKLQTNVSLDLNNFWLTGLAERTIQFNQSSQLLNCQMYHKKNYFLSLIKNWFGGNIKFIPHKNIYCYNSINYSSARKILKYFDHYPLMSDRYIEYLKFRKKYIEINQIY
uniref:Orf281 n=1 Tax=Schizosaccharomyces japonicus (strain yFS275 / FY16936) TaxID=402676 RepID=Q8HMZ3_SCHJY|nr:orf281 [Schizosaccharomyces japonicus]AAN37916.1 orf281 [Schizosaccharomyces japonicus]